MESSLKDRIETYNKLWDGHSYPCDRVSGDTFMMLRILHM